MSIGSNCQGNGLITGRVILTFHIQITVCAALDAEGLFRRG